MILVLQVYRWLVLQVYRWKNLLEIWCNDQCVISIYQIIYFSSVITWCISINILFLLHPTMIYKFYGGLTNCNRRFYPNDLWRVTHHLYQCLLECVVYSRTITLLDLGNVAQPSQKIPVEPLMSICLSC
jgi:hypothetical protein